MASRQHGDKVDPIESRNRRFGYGVERRGASLFVQRRSA